ASMRDWVVASGLIEEDGKLLLVQNRRRNGSLDWSTPGGVIEIADGESVVDGLTREVEEETGIYVCDWNGPVYEVEAVAEGRGWEQACSMSTWTPSMRPSKFSTTRRSPAARSSWEEPDGGESWRRPATRHGFMASDRPCRRGRLAGSVLTRWSSPATTTATWL